MIDELAFCYSKFWGDKKSKKEDRSDASNALVEILLSFASKPSKLFRRMSEQVFGVFADQITADGLQSLISVIEVKENLAGQQEMFDQQDDDDDDEEMEDADSLDSDVEVIDVDDADEDEDSDDDDDDDDEEEDNDEEEEDEEELAAFDAKLAEALGTHHPNDDDSSSDADMNDDEMEAVDEMLVKVFKARQQETTKKKDKQDAKETMTNFKNRVLDLLEIYVKKCHTSVLALDLILPLLRLTRKSTVKQISQRANDVLREYTRLCKGNAIPSLSNDNADNDDDDDEEEEDTIEPVWDLLRAIHKEAMISGPAAHSSSASQTSIFLVKVLVAQNKQNISQIVDIYAETRKAQMLSNKCHVQPGFFTDWNNWCVNAGKSMKN
jgi:DNA polymerase phi